jgi:lysine decarboxylase
VNESDAPLLAAWARFMAEPGDPFTVPGHKHRAGAVWPELGRVLTGDVPMFGGVGTIKEGPAALAAAEGLGAKLWGADWCRYSTGGSTHANQTVALAVGRPGDRVLVARTAHRSTLLGLILAGLDPVWLPPELDPETGLPSGLSLPALTAALAAHDDVAGVFVVEPSYVGTISDLRAIVSLAHARDVPVVVDQAWGAHLGFHPDYPPHALAVGADAMIISAHKTLPAYSQASIVAARTQRIDRDRLERGFEASATTSPAGSIVASIDGARAVLADPLGARLLDRLLRVVTRARERLRAAPELSGALIAGPEQFARDRFDPAKLVLNLAGSSVSGNDLEAGLIAAGLPVEMADRDTVIAIVTMLDDEDSVGRLCDEIVKVAASVPAVAPRHRSASLVWRDTAPTVAMPPRDAFFASHETVPAERALGRIAAELIAPYPPGIPVLVPGEVITAAELDGLRAAAATGIRIAYAADPTLRTLQVVA